MNLKDTILKINISILNMKIAVLGGSFDPITNAHIHIACEIINFEHADEVWMIPCGLRQDKPSLVTSTLHRFTMCNLAIDTRLPSKFPIKVSDIEIGREQALSTYDLLGQLKEQYPEHEFYFVIGTDLVDEIQKWKSGGLNNAGNKLIDENKFLVVNRPGSKWSSKLHTNFKLVGLNSGQELSSTEVRRRLGILRKGGKFTMAEGLIPSAVLAHILRYDLYERKNISDSYHN